MESLPDAAQFPAPAERPEANVTTQETPDGRTFMLMAAWSETGPPDTARLSIQIALDISQEAALLTIYQRKLAWALSLGILFSALAAFFVARRGLRPLAEMTRHMEGVTATQLHERLEPARWPEELSALASAFNAMLLRLADAFARLTQFSADLAHELRNPVNNLMGETEVALSRPRSAEQYRQILESNLEEYGRLSRIVESLLFLARAENTEVPLRTARLDGGEVSASVCRYHEALAEEKGIRLVCEAQGGLHADALLLKRALGNLLLNALQHTPTGGEIRVSLHPADDGAAEIWVRDTGCGIAPEHIPKLFDRFYRVDPARSEEGTGLGLAIVKSIMDLHRGSVTIQSKPGEGTLATLRFPGASD
jgi:two-component system heavy metal sensor histidine kinase CusS